MFIVATLSANEAVALLTLAQANNVFLGASNLLIVFPQEVKGADKPEPVSMKKSPPCFKGREFNTIFSGMY